MGANRSTQITFRPIATAPWGKVVLLIGISYMRAPRDMYIITGYREKDYHGGAWNDIQGHYITDQFENPTGWAPLPIDLKETSWTLPDTYMPNQIQMEAGENEDTEIVYAIGYAKGDKEYGMAHGPVLDIMDMLNVLPKEDYAAFIFSMKKNQKHQIVYRWHKGRQAWIKFCKEDAT